ncbi:MAG: antirestriction protein ArdA [Myxococcota bacterium]
MTHPGDGDDPRYKNDNNGDAPHDAGGGGPLPASSRAASTARDGDDDDEDGPAIYVACLAAYNAGTLHGRWIQLDAVCAEHDDADDAAEALRAMIASEMLATSPVEGAEEWRIDDDEGFEGLDVNPYETLETVVEMARLIMDHGSLAVAVAKHLDADRHVSMLGEVRTWLEEQYLGAYDSAEDWAAEWLDETGALSEVPESLRRYIDVAAYARDAQLSGDIVVLTPVAGGPRHVFLGR